jgi:hypothetical protein
MKTPAPLKLNVEHTYNQKLHINVQQPEGQGQTTKVVAKMKDW